jgi:mannosyltransferase
LSVDSLRARTPLPGETRRSGRRERALQALADLHLSKTVAVSVVLVLTLISLLLRIGQLRFHFWVDEGISVGIASHPLRELPSLLRQDGSPPLYYAMLHVWMQLFGRGEAATHVLSLIFAVITVPTAYWGGASLFGRRPGIYCAVIAAGLPFLTSYAQETRMYSIALFLSLLVAASFAHVFVFRRRRYLPLFIVSLAASLYTHNWALFLGLATFLTFLLCVRMEKEDRRPLWRDGAIAFGLVALLYLPWVPTLLYQAQHTGAPWAARPVIWSLSQGAYFLVGGRGAAVALLLAGGSGLLAFRVRGGAQRRTRGALISLLAIGLGTLLVAWLYAKVTPAWAFRYLAVLAGPLLLVVGFSLTRAARLGVVALALVCCFWVLDPEASTLDAKSNVAAAARVIRPHTSSNTLVLSTQPEQVPTLAYYLPHIARFGTPLGTVADPRVMDWRGALERFRHATIRSVLVPMLDSLKPGQRVALVVPTRFLKTPTWMALIRRDSVTWSHFMVADPHLQLLMSRSPHGVATGLPVRIMLFEDVSPSASGPTGHSHRA